MTRNTRDKWIILVLGVTTGFVLSRLGKEEKITEIDLHQPRTEAPRMIAKSALKRPKLIIEKEPAIHPIQTQNEIFINLRLEETSVRELEEKISMLRESLYTERTEEGWRVHLSSNDPLFNRLGIRDGDLITFSSMQAQLQKSESAGLATRLTTILDSLQR